MNSFILYFEIKKFIEQYLENLNKVKLMKRKLKKDIIIPKGTIFCVSPQNRQYIGNDHIECTIGLSKNTYGEFCYDISDDKKEMNQYFEIIED